MQNQPEQLKATVISLFPLPITEQKPGLYPGYFVIPAAPIGGLSWLVVGDAVYYTETKNEQIHAMRTAYDVLAESIVHDFMTSHIGRIVGSAEPGLFWVPGAFYSEVQIRELFGIMVDEAEQKQNKWFEELVKIADDTYARTQRHTSVSNLQRLAAQRINAQRPWVIRTGDSRNTCMYCKAEVPFGAIKCPNCREVLDVVAYKELKAAMDVE